MNWQSSFKKRFKKDLIKDYILYALISRQNTWSSIALEVQSL